MLSKKEENKRYFELLDQKRTELRAIKFVKTSDGKIGGKVVEIAEIDNYSQFRDFCNKWDKKANVYAGIHERIIGGTTSNDVSSVKIIAIDIDSIHPINDAATDLELEKCKKEVMKMVDELSKKYSRPSILMSGNGFQLLWKIRLIKINNNNRKLVESKIKAWINNIKDKYTTSNKNIDQIGDLARILKVSGTMSVKGYNTKKRPFRTSYFVEYHTDISDSLRDEILMTSIVKEKEVVEKELILPKQGRLEKFDYLLTKDQKLNFLYNGNTSGFKSRSEAELSLVCKLVYYEFSDMEIDLIMRNCAIDKWQKAHKQYKELTITKARLLIKEKKEVSSEVKLEDVYSVISKWLYLKDFYMVDLILAIILSQRLDDSPIWMIFVGPSGDGKSEMVRMIDELKCIYKVDQLTPNTLVSGNPKVEDLASTLNNKLLLITDFASILSLNGDSQKAIFAQLRNLYDGEAYKDTGAGARKHYTGLRVTLIANSTPIINHKILIHQDLGTRELIYRTDIDEGLLDFEKKTFKALENEGRKKDMRGEIRTIISSFFDNVKDIKKEFPDEIKNWLFEKAKWLSVMRSTSTIDHYSGELISDTAPEVPTRLLMQLKIIYHCLKSLDPDYPDKRAKEILLRIINSSAKKTRVDIFQYLQNCDGEITLSKIAEALRIGKKTVFTECNILWNLDLIQCRKERTIQFGKEIEINYWKKKDKVVDVKEEKVI